jgi:hypothetical protein
MPRAASDQCVRFPVFGILAPCHLKHRQQRLVNQILEWEKTVRMLHIWTRCE